MPPGLLEIVCERWRLTAVERAQTITVGEWNDVWRIETASGAFVP